jgi:hypothetical protein
MSLTLDRYLKAKGPLTPVQAAKVALQVAEQLEDGGGSFPVHPGRILAAQGKVELLAPTGEDLALPTVVGYPAYASPEVVQGAEPDARSTLYSLGCTLFELLAGEPPYLAANPKDLLHMHLEAPVPDVREHVQGVPDALAETIEELLEKDPNLRVQTTGELVRRLRKALASAPAPVAGASPPPPPVSRPAHSRAAPRLRERPVRGAAARPGALGERRPRGGSAPGRGGRLASASARRGLRARRHDERDGEHGEEHGAGAATIRKRSYPFTIIGGCIGLALGLVIIVQLSNKARHLPEEERQRETEVRTALWRTMRENRKEAFITRQEDLKKQGLARLAASRSHTGDPSYRGDLLVKAMDLYGDGPAGPQISKELVSVWAAAMTGGAAASKAEAESGFRPLKEAAQKLEAEGKLGEAIDKMMRGESLYKSTHGSEIDEFVLRLSAELTARWDKDQGRAQEMARAGEVDAALDIMRSAIAYGDGPIRQEAQRQIDSIQAQALRSPPSRPASGAKEGTEGEKGETGSAESAEAAESSEIDKEFEELQKDPE